MTKTDKLYSVIDDQFSMKEKEQKFLEKTGQEFTIFYKKYLPKLIFFVNQICGDKLLAEDIAIDSFMTGLNKIDDFESEKAGFSTWLFIIARNMTYHKLNQSKKFVSIDGSVDSDDDDSNVTTLKDFLQNESEIDYNEDHLVAMDLKAQIMKDSIKSLDKKFRKVIEMREIEKLQYKDIAAKLKRNESTVKSQIRNGRIKLIEMTMDQFTKIDKKFDTKTIKPKLIDKDEK
jgi:RNA polymerase sigma-70 factor (ECF subfamily)